MPEGQPGLPYTSPSDRRRRARPDTALAYVAELPSALLLDRLPVPILAVHENGSVVFVNRAFEDLLGCRRTELVDSPAERLFADDSDDRPAVVRTREYAHQIAELRHADGSTVKVLVSDSVLVRDDDPVAVVVMLDVTEQLWTLGPLPSLTEPTPLGPIGSDRE